MIETHVVNALLLPTLREEAAFSLLSFINGLVAPSFTFCAGLAFAITIQRKWDEYCSLNNSLWKYIARLTFILLVGYSLHIPIFSLEKMSNVHDEYTWQGFFQSDILQVISVTLLISVLLIVLIRNRKAYYAVISVLALLCIFSTPIIRDLDFSQIPIWVRGYFNQNYRSQFPLFPWSAFLLSGVVIGNIILRYASQLDSARVRRRLSVAAIVSIVISLVAEVVPVTMYPNHYFWSGSPEFFFVRLGIVSLLLAGCWFIEYRPAGFLRNAVTLIGTESLLVYVVHLLVVYGHTFEWSFIRLFGKTLGYLECFALSIGLIVAMYGLALGWSKLKRWNKKYATVIQYAMIAGVIVRFVAG
ncbi:MAG: DUF1624 domain-containing protein [Bacteroidetes bacterium]|nr:MAG: DUF1624 domain-containing protein [Bacteroidota bacterium]